MIERRMQAKQPGQILSVAQRRQVEVGIAMDCSVASLVDTGIHLLQRFNPPLQIRQITFFLLFIATGFLVEA